MRGDGFLAEVAKAVRPGTVTPRMYQAFKDYLSVAPARYFAGKYVVNPFIPPFPGKAFDKFTDTFFSDLGAWAPLTAALRASRGHVWPWRLPNRSFQTDPNQGHRSPLRRHAGEDLRHGGLRRDRAVAGA
jgi:hypothetical protein